jgi:hypothetical protein
LEKANEAKMGAENMARGQREILVMSLVPNITFSFSEGSGRIGYTTWSGHPGDLHVQMAYNEHEQTHGAQIMFGYMVPNYASGDGESFRTDITNEIDAYKRQHFAERNYLPFEGYIGSISQVNKANILKIPGKTIGSKLYKGDSFTKTEYENRDAKMDEMLNKVIREFSSDLFKIKF